MTFSTLLPKAYRTPLLIGVATFAGRIGFSYAKHIWTKENIVIIPATPEAEPITNDDNLEETFVLDEGDMYVVKEDVVEEVVETRINVFLADSSWNEEHELSQRTPHAPYIITCEEYVSDDLNYKQSTVTYYAEDDIMANEADVPIYDWNSLMGDLRWGHGSNDKNVVYIRNEAHRQEWEVLLHQGSYEVEVQGLHDDNGELRHSQRRILKFRDD
jgi:hypothetical protein